MKTSGVKFMQTKIRAGHGACTQKIPTMCRSFNFTITVSPILNIETKKENKKLPELSHEVQEVDFLGSVQKQAKGNTLPYSTLNTYCFEFDPLQIEYELKIEIFNNIFVSFNHFMQQAKVGVKRSEIYLIYLRNFAF